MSQFTWTIEKFSQLEDEYLFSLTFVVNENKWSLLLYPKGNYSDKYLSLYLRLDDEYDLPADWSFPTKFCISIVNQIDPSETIKQECDSTFNSHHIESGWDEFLPLSDFHDKSGGYLVEDTCVIQAKVEVSLASPVKGLDSSAAIDPVNPTYIEAQSFLQSLPIPLFKGHESFAKEILNMLISYPLDDLADSTNESAVMEFISVLANNISVFSDVQAKEILNLKATFPQIVNEWRDSIHVKGPSHSPLSTFKETKSVLQDLVKTEQGINNELEELNVKETDLKAQLEVINIKCQMLKEEIERVSKQMKIVCPLVEERATNIEAQDLEADIARYQELEQGLKSKWAAMRPLFA